MTTLAPTLSSRLWPRANTVARNLSLIVGGSLLVAALAQIRIPLPFTPVPLTGQTFGVLLVGALLGSRVGAASLALYLIEGLIGLPFFAGGGAGMAYLLGPTGGYLLGFVVAAYAVGWLCERGLERHLRTAFVPFLAGTLLIYLCGVTWLAAFLGPQKAITLGVLPFLAGDAMKLILAGLTLPATWKIIR